MSKHISKMRLLVLLLPFLLVACSSETTLETTYDVRGEFIGLVMDGQAMRVAHERIPNYMDAMTMNLPLSDPSEASLLQEGDKVRFTLVVTETGYTVRGIERLDPATELQLADDHDHSDHDHDHSEDSTHTEGDHSGHSH